MNNVIKPGSEGDNLSDCVSVENQSTKLICNKFGID